MKKKESSIVRWFVLSWVVLFIAGTLAVLWIYGRGAAIVVACLMFSLGGLEALLYLLAVRKQKHVVAGEKGNGVSL